MTQPISALCVLSLKLWRRKYDGYHGEGTFAIHQNSKEKVSKTKQGCIQMIGEETLLEQPVVCRGHESDLKSSSGDQHLGRKNE